MAGAAFWHTGLFLGITAIVLGWNGGVEWLKIPKPFTPLLVLGRALVGIPLVMTLLRRKWITSPCRCVPACGGHSFPILYLFADLPGMHFGVQAGLVD